jgi:hypothetical protein
MIAHELRQQLPPNRTAPIKFQVTEPIRRLHQRRSFAHRRVRDAHAISRGAKLDLLFHVGELTGFKLEWCYSPSVSIYDSRFTIYGSGILSELLRRG